MDTQRIRQNRSYTDWPVRGVTAEEFPDVVAVYSEPGQLPVPTPGTGRRKSDATRKTIGPSSGTAGIPSL